MIFVIKEIEARVKEEEEIGNMKGKSGCMEENKTLFTLHCLLKDTALRSLRAAHGLTKCTYTVFDPLKIPYAHC